MYNIKNIHSETPQSGVRYLFDTNIWMEVLSPFSSKEYRPYIDFFNKTASAPAKHDIKIYMPAIILSELVGKHIAIGFDEYLKEKSIPPFSSAREKKRFFKEKYRSTAEYIGSYQAILGDIRGYHQSLIFQDQIISHHTCSQFIKKIPLHMEFNDYLLCDIASFYQCPLVTHDGDFNYEDIEIVTANPKLLALTTVPASS